MILYPLFVILSVAKNSVTVVYRSFGGRYSTQAASCITKQAQVV